MNSVIEKAKKEYDDGNFDVVLEMLDNVEFDGHYEKLSTILRFSALMELKRYGDSLEIINSMIENNPYDELLWFEKVRCHFFLNDEKAALKSLKELERIIDQNDLECLVEVARFYNLMGVDEKVIEYCDKALAIDESYKPALFEKSYVAIRRKDGEIIDEISEKLLGTSQDIFSLVSVLLLKLFSKDYDGAVNLIESHKEFDDDLNELLKSIIYKQITDDLNVDIVVTDKIQMPIDVAVDLLLKYYDEGIDSGEIDGVYYLIV